MVLNLTASDHRDPKNQSDKPLENSSDSTKLPSADQQQDELASKVTPLVSKWREWPVGRVITNILCNLLLILACLLLLVSSVIFALSRDPRDVNLGYQFFSVLTDSMAPRAGGPPDGFSAGDMILVDRCEPALIQVGDIIAYATDESAETYLTHRVVEVKTELNGRNGRWFVTRGDANNADDPPVSAELLVGKKIFNIPKLGGIIHGIQQNIIAITICMFATIGFTIALRYYFTQPVEAEIEKKPEKCEPATTIQTERMGPHTYIYR
jgi:signal peptidase I